MSTTYEAHLQELLELMQGKRWPYSKGLWTHKTADPEQQQLHEACVELERRGHLFRQWDGEHGTGWMPLEPDA